MSNFSKSPLVAGWGDSPAWLIANERKAPCTPDGRPMAGWNDEGATKTFTEARKSMTARSPHIGYRSNQIAGLAAFDLDDCLNAGQGVIDDVALWVLTKLNTYTEITPSGKALRAYAIVKGEHDPILTEKKTSRTWGVFDEKAGAVVQTTFKLSRGVFFNASKFVVHTAQPYHWALYGVPVMTLKTITVDELDLICAAFWMFDRVPHSEYEEKQMLEAWRADLAPQPQPQPQQSEPAKGGAVIEPKSKEKRDGEKLSVIDAFNESVDLRVVMEAAGYTISRDGKKFARPGKKLSEGISGYFDGDHAFTFSSNDPLNVHCEKGNQVRAFDVLLECQFNGDMKTAVREIAKALGMSSKAEAVRS